MQTLDNFKNVWRLFHQRRIEINKSHVDQLLKIICLYLFICLIIMKTTEFVYLLYFVQSN